ncbi:MAG: shikimate dehydrogenase [Candidatus Marsarchaeota archaeon]|nr:shikimate dehydrogenase [Candidatus Marsarchaeota archaeon]
MAKSISGYTSLFCIIGMPAHHSLSPTIHNAMYNNLGMDAVFLAFDVPASQLESAIKGIKAYGIKGMTLTSPHKQMALKLVDHVSKEAKELGAVNAIVPKGGKLYGYNTDEPGSIMSLKNHGLKKSDTVSLFGSGGAARAIAFGLAHYGIKKLNIINRTLEHAEELGKSLGKHFPKLDVEIFRLNSKESENAIKRSRFILNATNITLENSTKTPVPSRLLSEGMVVFDANYVPINNKLLSDAKRKGCETINGLEMLVYNQAVAFKLFTGKEPNIKLMMEAAERAVKHKPSSK